MERQPLITVHEGDVFEFMRDYAGDMFDGIIGDPPYGVGIADWDVAPPQSFLEDCLRITTGPILLFGGAATVSQKAFLNLEPVPERMLLWTIPFSMNQNAKHGVRYRWHPVWCWNLSKQLDNALIGDVLKNPVEFGAWWSHPCTKPVGLMADLIRAFIPEGGSLLDPFAGSGSTLVAAARTGRNAVGVEINPEYAAICRKRLEFELTDHNGQLRLDGTAPEFEMMVSAVAS